MPRFLYFILDNNPFVRWRRLGASDMSIGPNGPYWKTKHWRQELSDYVIPQDTATICELFGLSMPSTYSFRSLYLVVRSRRWSEGTTSLRYLTVSCTHVPVRKFPERLPTESACLILLFFPPWCVYLSVHRRWSIDRDRKSVDFGREGGCVGPLFAPPFTSARVQNRFQFAELARDMSSNCTRSHWDYRLLR